MDHVRIRLLGQLVLALCLMVAITILSIHSGQEPIRLYDALLILVGYLARDATTRVHQNGPPAPNAAGTVSPKG